MAPHHQPLFATYLLPSFTYPFRRRQQSTDSTSSDASTTSHTPSLTHSGASSSSASPSSSPPAAYFIPPPHTARGLLSQALETLSKPIPRIPSAAKDGKRNKSRAGKLELTRAQPNILRCSTCSTDLAFTSQIVSKGFTGRHGRAYLVAPPPFSPKPGQKKSTQPAKAKELINVKVGRSVNRELLTGAHVVADVTCIICGSVLGWKYVDARELAQKYKIGKYILEMKRVVVGSGWEDCLVSDDVDEEPGMDTLVMEELLSGTKVSGKEEENDSIIVFDSEDEDECEDLFAGTWDAEVVAKRRRGRVAVRKREVNTVL